MNPVDFSDIYDTIQLDGVTSPGKVTISGHDRTHKWDIKEADGHGGASTTYKGEQLAQPSCSFYLVKDEGLGIDEFAEWESFQTRIEAALPASGTPKALIIYHPDLLANKISLVCPMSIGGMVHDGKGGATVVVKFLEYRPAKKKGGAPVSKTAAGTPKKPDPNADLKAEIATLTAQAQKPAA